MEVRGPQRRGQSGKAEVKGHSGQSPWWGRVLESSERVEQQGLWEERPREAWGPPQNGEAQARLLQMLLFRTLRTLVFQTLHSPQSLHPSALSPLSAPEAQLLAAPSGIPWMQVRGSRVLQSFFGGEGITIFENLHRGLALHSECHSYYILMHWLQHRVTKGRAS